MSSIVERHELKTMEELDVRVDVWDNGDVDVWIGNENLTITNLAEIVRFVETHSRCEMGDLSGD